MPKSDKKHQIYTKLSFRALSGTSGGKNTIMHLGGHLLTGKIEIVTKKYTQIHS